MVKTLREHQLLVEKAKEKNVLLQIEVHKRFDPIYNDARMRIQKLGKFNYFTSYMSQPKFQLETFSAWVGKYQIKNVAENISMLTTRRGWGATSPTTSTATTLTFTSGPWRAWLAVSA